MTASRGDFFIVFNYNVSRNENYCLEEMLYQFERKERCALYTTTRAGNNLLCAQRDLQAGADTQRVYVRMLLPPSPPPSLRKCAHNDNIRRYQ